MAVDATAFYAIDDTAIGKYDKGTGRKVAAWRAAPDQPFIHLNSGVVVGGELVCAHSNYPALPMHSTIEVFDTATLAHVRTRDLGTRSRLGDLDRFSRRRVVGGLRALFGARR